MVLLLRAYALAACLRPCCTVNHNLQCMEVRPRAAGNEVARSEQPSKDVNPHGAEVLIPVSEFHKDRLYLPDYPAKESEKQ